MAPAGIYPEKMNKPTSMLLALLGVTLTGAAAFTPAILKAPAPAAVDFPEAVTTVRGVMVYNDAWNGDYSQAGIYTVEVRPGGAVACEHRSEVMSNTAAALLHEGTLYCVEASLEGYFYRQYNASTWASTGSRQEIDLVNVPSDLTYDSRTGKAYGGFWDDNYGGFSRFATFGLTDAEARDIESSQRDDRDFITITAAPDGTIYALHGTFNYLKRFDPRTGDETKIGLTGIDCDVDVYNRCVSSMCWDAENEQLIAVVSTVSGPRYEKVHSSALYVIKPHLLEDSRYVDVTKVMDMPGNAAMAGLHVVAKATPPSAPSAARDINVEFSSSDPLKGKVVFTAPTLSFGGETLSAPLLAQVSVNGTVVATLGDIQPGAVVRTSDIDFSAGDNAVRVVMAIPGVRGESAEKAVYAGVDTPSPVTDLVLEVSDSGVALLSWKAPAEGVHGGALDPASLVYTVRRVQDNKIVAENLAATEFTESNIPATIRSVSYAVTAKNAAGSSAEVESNKCLASGALSVPFSEGFDTQDNFDLWTLLNTNPASTWAYNKNDKRAYYRYASDKTAADNWLISPAIRMEGGKAYKISYAWCTASKTYPESFAVHCGVAPTAEAMGAPLAEHLKVVNGNNKQSASTVFRPEATGTYCVGIHAISDPWMNMLYIDDISVEEIDSRVPAPVADLTIEAGAEGALQATVSFTTPETDTHGASLKSLTEARLYRRGTAEPIAVFSDITPGEKLSFTDKGVKTAGLTGYSVTTSNSVGESVPADAEAWIGVDAPGSVKNLRISEVDGHPHLEWIAPDKGLNGGWFDSSALTYRIVRDDGTVLAQNHNQTSFTDDAMKAPAAGQTAHWYLVTSYTGTTKGGWAQSATLLFGTPYTAPVAETFADASMALYPWIAQSSSAINYAWTLDNMGYNPSVADQNGDMGLATFHAVGEPMGVKSYFYSPKISIEDLDSPVLSFWMYHSTTAGDGAIEVLVAAESDTFESTGDTFAREAEASGWVRHTVDLAAYKNAEWIRVGFCGTGDQTEDIYLDNISFDNLVRFDAALTFFNVPEKIAAGQGFTANVGVSNTGAASLENITLTICDASGSVLASSVLESLPEGSDRNIELDVPGLPKGTAELLAAISCEADLNASNNEADATVKVVEPVLPGVSGIEVAVSADGVALSWASPVQRGEICDDFESYKDFIIDGVGQWSMWDGDYDVTYMINTSYGAYPNCTDRKAFQVLNANVLGIDIWSQGTPHSGNKMMAALASQIYVNNDWLISPRLNGAEQWISFWARSFTHMDTPAERMRVYYSMTTTSPADFIELTSDYVELPEEWVEYRYHLPEGARYFAIACVSDGAFAMFVDDAVFNDLTVPVWTLTGYEIARDGEAIGTSEMPSFVDADPKPGLARYTVTPIYTEGRGRTSDPVDVGTTGIAGIDGADITPVNVYNVQGMLLRRGVPRAEAVRNLPAGTYIVGNEKIVVR